jgi:Restriction endonuclease
MPGRLQNKLQYLSGLNEKDFPYLIADILKLHLQHTNVKVVDGTGDGKRDIFSISEKKEKTITQCKFHYDFNTTSGTSETDEIVIALNKFGCSKGVFCTSGKLSPQSKREYLDNYPQFDLIWFEGHEIVDIVLENPILRKIWFEGEKIH